MYKERNNERRSRKTVDFILDEEDGQILPEESSGTNELMSSYDFGKNSFVANIRSDSYCLLAFLTVRLLPKHYTVCGTLYM